MGEIMGAAIVPLGSADDMSADLGIPNYAPQPGVSGADHGQLVEDGLDYVTNNPIKSLPGWNEGVTGDEHARTLADVAYSLVDWQTRHRANNVAASGVWDFGASLLPEDNQMGKFGQLENMLQLHRAETVQMIHACPNMCVAFWDPTHPTLVNRMELRNAHRTSCPECGAARYEEGTSKPVRVFWYMPIKYWLQDLFSKGDLVPHMANDIDPAKYPDGHVRRYKYYLS
jgi:hypothetical protein